jgi:PTH1 family peptidyl-tRNA hydrolase
MNLSGDAVRKIVDFFKLDVANQILICVDDIDLPLAELRMRKSGGPGTHNGMKSLVDTFGEGFPRLRIGLGTPPTGGDLSGWVLSAMKKEEEKALQESFDTLSGLVSDFVLGSS